MRETESADIATPSSENVAHSQAGEDATHATSAARAIEKAAPQSTTLCPLRSPMRPHSRFITAWVPTRIAVNRPTCSSAPSMCSLPYTMKKPPAIIPRLATERPIRKRT